MRVRHPLSRRSVRLFCVAAIHLVVAPGCRSSATCLPGAVATPTKAASTAPATAAGETSTSSRSLGAMPRNVIFMLSDGTGPEAWTLARWVQGSNLNADEMLTGAVRTYGADSIITDSAPGASAYATGIKGSDKAIAVGASSRTIDAATTDPKLAYVPLVTLLEGAKLTGYATGLVATSSVQHATPAAFSAHVPHRDQYEEIAEQQVYQGIDVVLSGGAQYLTPKSTPGGVRMDGENLIAVLQQRGYRTVATREELLARPDGRVWGAFAANDMAYELDRPRFAPTQPSLAEMTDYAISNLSSSPSGRSVGFFLFVEGSKVDWSAHANDPVGMISDLLAFDAAVGRALRFAKSHANTQVVVVADHGTGGISIGTSSDSNYSLTDDDSVTHPLRSAKVTAERLSALVGTAKTNQEVREHLEREWGMRDVTEQESTAVLDAVARQSGVMSVLARMISRRARIGWTTNGHTGADVYLYAYGPERPSGLVENTAVGLGMARFLGLDLERLQRRLYVDALATLPALGYSVTLDRNDPRNGELVAVKGTLRARMPWAKNLLVMDGKVHALEGIVVHAEKLGRVYIPQQALDLMQARHP